MEYEMELYQWVGYDYCMTCLNYTHFTTILHRTNTFMHFCLKQSYTSYNKALVVHQFDDDWISSALDRTLTNTTQIISKPLYEYLKYPFIKYTTRYES